MFQATSVVYRFSLTGARLFNNSTAFTGKTAAVEPTRGKHIAVRFLSMLENGRNREGSVQAHIDALEALVQGKWDDIDEVLLEHPNISNG